METTEERSRGLSAGAFRDLLQGFGQMRVPLEPDAERAATERRREELKAAIEAHSPDHQWRTLLHAAREAAERGQREYLLLRFPSDSCADSGRAVTRQAANWPETLTGDAASIYAYWRDHLQSGGFQLSARILEYSRAGFPGDVGLFLVWSEAPQRAAARPASPAPAARSPKPAKAAMQALLLLTASGPLVILTSYASVLAPELLEKLGSKGIRKFVAFEMPLPLVQLRYSNHFVVVAHDLHESDDLRVLDFDGQHIFRLFRFTELGVPIFHEGD